MIIKNVFEDDKVFESSAIDLRSIFQLLQLHEIANADLEYAWGHFRDDWLSSSATISAAYFVVSLLFFTEDYFLSKSVTNAHQGTKCIFFRSLALELPIHYNVYMLSRLNTFPVNELTWLEFVHVRVVHQVLESFQRKFREQWMSESDVLQGKHALDILKLSQTLICLD